MIHSGGICAFTHVLSHDVRPSSSRGATITPGNNTYGSYATVLGTPLASDAYAIEIMIQGINSSGAVTDSLTTIGLDQAGGTSYTDFISHLVTSGAGGVNAGAPFRYFFPVKIPAGSTIGAKGTINNATVGTQSVAVKLWTKPTRPEYMPKYGTYVTTFGEDTANSAGTSVTAGTTSNGSYTQLGSAVSGNPLWFWQFSYHQKNDVSWASPGHRGDLAHGDASNKIPIIEQQETYTTSTEAMAMYNCGEYRHVPVGSIIYARIWSGTSDTAFGAIAYGVGG